MNNVRDQQEGLADFRGQTIKGLGWSGVSQVVRQLLQFAVTVVLARLLVPTDFGALAMIAVFTGFAGIFVDLGLGAALVQKQEATDIHLHTTFWLNLAAGTAISAIVFLAAPAIAALYLEPRLRTITRVIALNFLLSSLCSIPYSQLQKKLEFKNLAKVEIASFLGAGVVAIVLAWRGLGVWSLVAQTLLATLISAGLLWRLCHFRPALRFSRKAFRELFSFSSHYLGFNALAYWIRNFDNLLVGKYIGAAALGIYSRAYNLMLYPVNQLSGVISRVMFPALSQIQHDIPRVRSLYLKATRAIALVSFPLMVGLLCLAEPFVLNVFGSKWEGVIPVLEIFSLLGLVQSIGTTVGWIYTSQGRTDIMFKWSLFAGTIYVTSFIIGLRAGIVGIATAYAFSNYVLLWYPSWTIAGRLIQLNFADMVRNLAGPFLCSMAMGGAVWLLSTLLPFPTKGWLYLLTLVISGMAIYFALIRLFNLRAYRDVLEIIQDQIKSRAARNVRQGGILES